MLINSLKLYATNYESEVINEFTEKYSTVKFLDLNMDKYLYTLDERAFYNTTHLNYRGSIQVTERLTDSISKWFDIKKENNITHSFQGFNLINYSYVLNENEDKFIKLEFDSIPDSVLGKTLEISLFPKDTLNFSKDTFQLEMNKNEIIKAKESSVLIKPLNTKISEKELNAIELFFHNGSGIEKSNTVFINK